MKQLFVLLALFISTISFSQTRVMTDEERELLKNNPTFTYKCTDAVNAFANYWSIHDGAGLSTEAERITWAKNRKLGVSLLVNGPTYRPQEITAIFLDAARGQVYTLGTAPETVENIIAQWVSLNSFETFAQSYFKLWGDLENFSVGN